MAKKRSKFKSRAVPRSLSVSLAGIRAGGALAVDGAVQRVLRRSNSGEDSSFARREAQRFAQELERDGWSTDDKLKKLLQNKAALGGRRSNMRMTPQHG